MSSSLNLCLNAGRPSPGEACAGEGCRWRVSKPQPGASPPWKVPWIGGLSAVEMGAGCWRNPLLLLAALVLAAKLGHFQRWGGFQEKSMSQKNINSTLKFFIETYNNASNDTYLFGVDKLLRSQMQVCASVSPDVHTAPILTHSDKWGHPAVPRETEVMVSPSGEWPHLAWMCFRAVQAPVLP